MWYKPRSEDSIYTPSVLVFPDRIEENIRRMISLAGTAERLRTHVKTHKMAEVISLQLEYGIRKFKCATLSEVEMVAANGGEDILFAYPLTGPAIAHFIKIMLRFPEVKFAVTVDSKSVVQKLSDEGKLRGVEIQVFVDLDNGMHRTGVAPDQADELIHYILNTQNLSLGGFHIYDGHIHEKDVAKRERHCKRDFESVNDLVENMEEKGIEVKELACGGTPTFPIHAMYNSRTLCPGTPLLWDAGYAGSMPDLDFLPAAVLATRVISKPGGHVCLDLGYKAVASEMPHPRVKFLDLGVPEVINHSEEHLVLSSPEFSKLSIGDMVYALPIHVCPTIALHDQVYVVKDQILKDVWRVIARNRKYE